MHKEKTVKEQTIYDGKILKLNRDEVLLENGEMAIREVIHHSGGAGVLAIDDDENLYLVKQFRYPYHEEMLEIPAGKLALGEDQLECAKRELEEETGMLADKWESLGEYRPTPGYTDEKLYIFLATKLKNGSQRLDEDEFLDVIKCDLFHAVKLIERGEITDAKTVIAIYKYLIDR